MTHAELFEKMKEAARRSTSQLKRLSAESQYQMNCFNLFDIDGKYTVWLNPEPIIWMFAVIGHSAAIDPHGLHDHQKGSMNFKISVEEYYELETIFFKGDRPSSWNKKS